MCYRDENVHLSVLSYAEATHQCGTLALEMWLVQWRNRIFNLLNLDELKSK